MAWWMADGDRLGSDYQAFNTTSGSVPPFCQVVLGSDGVWYPYNCTNTHTDGFWCVKDAICVDESKLSPYIAC